MGLLGNIIGYFNPNETPTSAVTPTHQHLMNQQMNAQRQVMMNQQIAQAQMNHPYGSGGQGMKGIGGYSQATPPMYRVDEMANKLRRYAEMCGDAIQEISLPNSAYDDDVKVALLKMADAETIIKGVGLKISDTKIMVYRDQGGIYV
jgi:hypothetical protein